MPNNINNNKSLRSISRPLSVLTILAVASATFGASTAQAAELRSESGWKCSVSIPIAKAAVEATRLSLQAISKNIPKAEKKLESAKAGATRAQDAADAAKKASIADPSNSALAEASKTAASVARAKKTAVNTASTSLKGLKAGLPTATSAVKKAEAKLAELNASCA